MHYIWRRWLPGTPLSLNNPGANVSKYATRHRVNSLSTTELPEVAGAAGNFAGKTRQCTENICFNLTVGRSPVSQQGGPRQRPRCI
jgi:hypothetical protein